LKVAVVFGGDSMEREVSVASGAQVVAALRKRGHDVLAVDAERGPLSAQDEAREFAKRIDRMPPPAIKGSGVPRVVADLAERDVDVVFLAMHGTTGEDGTLQSLLDLHGLRYTGSGRLGSALAWDKAIAKQLFRDRGIPTPEWHTAPVTAEEIERDLGFPVIVKPTGQGSTVGLSKVAAADGLAQAIELAARYDGEVLIERYIAGRELTVGVLGDTALSVGEIIPASGDIFDYESKYQPDAAQEIFPADISRALAAEVERLGLLAHSVLRLAHYSRVDFRLDNDDRLWCLEVNTLPGLSPGSLLPKSAAAVGIEFDELCERICRLAVA
jgi:D-alanine-D-alanine ligase